MISMETVDVANLSDEVTQVAVAAQRSKLDEDVDSRFKRCQRRYGIFEVEWSTPSPPLHVGAWEIFNGGVRRQTQILANRRNESFDPWPAVSSCEPCQDKVRILAWRSAC